MPVAVKPTFALAIDMLTRGGKKALPWRSLRLGVFALVLFCPFFSAQALVVQAHDPTEGQRGAERQHTHEALEPQRLREYSIKAAVIYNFAKFTSWPERSFAGKDSPLRFCILGDDPFGESLKTIVGKKVRGREMVVSRPDRITENNQCHLVFVSQSEDFRLDEVLQNLSQRPVLSISEIDDFARAGGMITIKVPEDRIRFEVNLSAARASGLFLSSRLLGLAQVLHKQETRALHLDATSSTGQSSGTGDETLETQEISR